MSPLIDSPSFHAILQIVVLFGTICSIVGPLVSPYTPRIGSALTRLGAFGFDVGKLVGGSGNARTAAKIAGSVMFVLMLVVMPAVLLFSACAGAPSSADVAKASKDVQLAGDDADALLRGGYKAEQAACLLTLDKAQADACLANVRAKMKAVDAEIDALRSP